MVEKYESKMSDLDALQTEEEVVERVGSYLWEFKGDIESSAPKVDYVDTSKKYGIALDGSEYNTSNSFTSRSWITYKLYDQTKWPWSMNKYSDGRTMKQKWCMLTSAAVVASSLWNFSITPWDLFNRHRHELVATSVPAESKWKLKQKVVKTNSEIIDWLKSGNPVIIKVEGKNRKWWKSKFTSSQHYMSLLDISEDGSKVFVGNSHISDWGNYSSNGWYSTNEVLTSVREATVFYRS